MAEAATVRLQNTSAHLKYLNLGDAGGTIAVPPTEDGTAGIKVTFDNDAERDAFERVLKTPAIKAWIDSGELVVHRSGSPAPALPHPSSFEQPAPSAAPDSAESSKRRRDKE